MMGGKKKKKKKEKKSLQVFPPIALTGSGYKGKALLNWLEQDPRFPHVIYLNNKRPDIVLKKSKFYRIDLTETLADAQIAEILKKENIDTLVHTAIPVTPPHDVARAHELISVGSMYICNAAAEAKVRKLILSSTADVYGAYPNNPNYLTEDHPPRGGANSHFLSDKIDAENAFLKFAKRQPDRIVTILRSATILGPTIKSFKTDYLSRPIVPTILGYDPMMQFVHEEDLLQAFKIVITEDHPGIFNIASSGVLPLSKAIKLMDKINFPMLLLGLKSLVQLLWYLDISPAPANRIDYLKYLCCVSTDKAEKEMGFKPRYSCKDAIVDFIGAERLRGVKLNHPPKEVIA
jgi:UDP-glucose 4-epimerase